MRSAAELLARTAGAASRWLGRGGGTSLPGVVLLKLRPTGAADLASELGEGAIVVSATNGKTTTARLITEGLREAGHSIVANRAGANLIGGVTSALLAQSREKRQHSLGLFEVDEAALPAVVAQVQPDVILLLNLFRDQLDRYGELETLVATWRAMIASLPPTVTLVLNADDPAIASLAGEHPTVVWFGVDDQRVGLDSLAHAADSTRCRACGELLEYDLITLGHLGHWRCPNGDSSRPNPAIAVSSIQRLDANQQQLTIDTPDGSFETVIALPGVHNAYNAAAAAAALFASGVTTTQIAAGLRATQAAFGRTERVTIDGRELVMMLAKNPTGANANVRTVLDASPTSADGGAPAGLHVLAMLNDRTADGQDVSWIWDVDYEPLLPHLARLTVAGDRARDLALRFRYGGIDETRMCVEPDPAKALNEALRCTPEGGVLYALPTYTAMLDLRHVLTERGYTSAFWEDA